MRLFNNNEGCKTIVMKLLSTGDTFCRNDNNNNSNNNEAKVTKILTSFFIFSQICISFLLHCGLVVIPKSVTEKRIIENFNSTKISLDDSEVKKIQNVDKNFRLFHNLGIWLPKGSSVEEVFDYEKDEQFVVV